jgi:hypothetical protein
MIKFFKEPSTSIGNGGTLFGLGVIITLILVHSFTVIFSEGYIYCRRERNNRRERHTKGWWVKGGVGGKLYTPREDDSTRPQVYTWAVYIQAETGWGQRGGGGQGEGILGERSLRVPLRNINVECQGLGGGEVSLELFYLFLEYPYWISTL